MKSKETVEIEVEQLNRITELATKIAIGMMEVKKIVEKGENRTLVGNEDIEVALQKYVTRLENDNAKLSCTMLNDMCFWDELTPLEKEIETLKKTLAEQEEQIKFLKSKMCTCL